MGTGGSRPIAPPAPHEFNFPHDQITQDVIKTTMRSKYKDIESKANLGELINTQKILLTKTSLNI